MLLLFTFLLCEGVSCIDSMLPDLYYRYHAFA